MCLDMEFVPLSHKGQILLMSEPPKKNCNWLQTPCFRLVRMLRLRWISGFGCKEERVKPDRQTVPHPGQWHHRGDWFQTPGKAAVTTWPFISPSFLHTTPPTSRIPIQTCPQPYRNTVLDHSWYLDQNLPVPCPTKSWSWKGIQSYIPFSFKAWIPNNLPNGHFSQCLHTSRQNRTCYPHWEASMIIGLSPLCWVKQCLPSIFCSLVLDHP